MSVTVLLSAFGLVGAGVMTIGGGGADGGAISRRTGVTRRGSARGGSVETVAARFNR